MIPAHCEFYLIPLLCDQLCQWLEVCWSFSLDTPASPSVKIDSLAIIKATIIHLIQSYQIYCYSLFSVIRRHAQWFLYDDICSCWPILLNFEQEDSVQKIKLLLIWGVALPAIIQEAPRWKKSIYIFLYMEHLLFILYEFLLRIP